MGSPDRLDESSANPGTEVASAQAELASAKRELKTLYSALDNLQSGLLLLDGDLRAIYSNPALHASFDSLSPERIRNSHPSYAELLQTAAATSTVNIQGYVERRLDWVRSGDPTPMDLPMANGVVLRCHVAALPDGGRMLIYSDVTDIVRNADAMERLATIDGMTGIYNRRHFLALADRAWISARRLERPISFLMIDIDHFKSINDNFGHEIGDRMIVHLAHLARACTSDSDVLARIGGEEFALLLPGTALGSAKTVADRLRRSVAKSPLFEAPHTIRSSVSIGVAAANEETRSVSDLMKAADQALYHAKNGGRDRVVCRGADKRSPRMRVGAAH